MLQWNLYVKGLVFGNWNGIEIAKLDARFRTVLYFLSIYFIQVLMWKIPYENVRPDKLLIHLDIWSRQRLNIKWRSQLNGTEQWKAPKRTWDSVGKEQWISSQECWLVFSCKSYQIRSIFLAKLNSPLIQESSDYPCNHQTNILKHIKAWFFFNPLTSMSDQDRISPYNI